MAKDMDDYEFWLPSEILTDDDILMDFKPKPLKGSSTGSPEDTGVYFPAVAPSGFGSNSPFSGFTSPDESLRSSTTETESDEEEDCLAGLTQKMAHSSLQESSIWKTQKHQATSGSPQSTLCGFTGCGSPNCRSPPAYHPGGDGAWDLLCAAAGEVARMRMVEEAAAAASWNRGRRVMVPPRQRSYNTRSNMGLLSDKSLSYHQLQTERFRQLQKQQMMKQPESVVQDIGRNRGRPLGLAPSAWPTLNQSQLQQRKQQPGSGMRAVFLGDTGAKKHCAGTGVFLPRPVTETNTRPAPTCSTVLLPERVIQTLTMKAPTQLRPHNHSPFTPNHAAVASQCKVFQGQEMQHHNGRSNGGMMNQEFRLPSDWTY